MNGKTEISEINPYSAEADRRTYGCRWLNFSTYGRRLLKLTIWRMTLDIYWGGSWKVFTRNGGGANGSSRYWTMYWPCGSITWLLTK